MHANVGTINVLANDDILSMNIILPKIKENITRRHHASDTIEELLV